jgi:undecaprenyl pyrophosphate phosphatase UppP
MATTQLIGKIFLTLSAVIYGFIPPFVDFNKTHATNPLWTGHARFHLVWQVIITFLIAVMSIYLLWFSNIEQALAFNLSFTLGLLILGGFFLNIFSRHLYQGTLRDPNGVPLIMGKIEANVLGFTIAIILLLLGYFIYLS